MSSLKDNNPELSLRVVESHQEEWDLLGRLYQKPGTVLPADYKDKEVLRNLLRENILMPSITNVLSVRAAPHLFRWGNKLVAEEAAAIEKKFPGLISSKPAAGIRYLKDTPNRYRDFWGNQGSRIHKVLEKIGLQQPIEKITLTEYEQGCIDSFKRWLDKFQPTFKHVELTGFGVTSNGEAYAGTTDAELIIDGEEYLVDYKCVVNNTPILLPDGTEASADSLKEGDKVVAWTKEKGLHVSKVSYAGDNGTQPVIRITTETGHQLTTTYNHPYLASRKAKSVGFAKAENLREGDTLFLSRGWSYNPAHSQVRWSKAFSFNPYLYGLLWSLVQYQTEVPELDTPLLLPGTTRSTTLQELKENGFSSDDQGRVLLRAGLNLIAKRKHKTVEQVFEDLVSPLHGPIYSAPKISAEGFFSGIQELFGNREMQPDNFLVPLPSNKNLRALQQVYYNYSYPIDFVENMNGVSYLRIPYPQIDEVIVHGHHPTRIVSIEHLEPQSTIALEVEGAHTHITAGIITHNTNKNGLHSDVSLQLTAAKYFSNISPDNKTLVPMQEVKRAIALHISPKKVTTVPVSISERRFEEFSALRKLWPYHVFEGKHENARGVLAKQVNTPEELTKYYQQKILPTEIIGQIPGVEPQTLAEPNYDFIVPEPEW